MSDSATGDSLNLDIKKDGSDLGAFAAKNKAFTTSTTSSSTDGQNSDCVATLGILDTGPYGTPPVLGFTVTPPLTKVAHHSPVTYDKQTKPIEVNTNTNIGNPDGEHSNPKIAEKIGIVTEEDTVSGKGQFDKYMRAGNNQLTLQYKEGRIKGADYATAFITMQDNMMTQANNFVLGEFDARVKALLIAAQIEEMQLDGYVKRSLLYLQLEESAMKVRLLEEQIQKTANETQLIATQEAELRKDSEWGRWLTSTKIDEIIENKQFVHSKEIELRLGGSFERQKVRKESEKILGETRFMASKEKMMLANDNIQRMLTMQTMYHEQGKISETCWKGSLIEQQIEELKLNGVTKRALETEQVNLFKAQGKGFADKNRNDTYKSTLNAWAINATEVDGDADPVQSLRESSVSTMIENTRSQAGI
ncbi:MAG: hypothetical protein DRJ35_07965 [Thermoprotei archaeon]|nr:MAG: hypothetical protein DRJ35_07965 [Thermoprotei archaeon]